MEAMDAFHIMQIKELEKDNQMEDLAVKEVILLYKLISPLTIFHILEERLFKGIAVELEDLEEGMVKMVEKPH